MTPTLRTLTVAFAQSPASPSHSANPVACCAFVGLFVVAHAGSSWPARAQGPPDLEAMLKWQQAQVIHYDVVAQFRGDTSILEVPRNSPIGAMRAAVADRYEISFDWDPNAMAMVGEAVIRNFPATLPDGAPAGKCGPPKFTGSYDDEVVSAKTGVPGSNSLELTVKSSYPSAALAYANEKDVCTPLTVPSASRSDVRGLLVPLGMFFAMPAAVPENLTVGKDGKTMTLKEGNWTYTYTLRIAR